MALETVQINGERRPPGHPWVDLSSLVELPESVSNGQSLRLIDSQGHSLGCGVFDRKDPCAVWRRYSRAEEAPLDEAYLSTALVEAFERRSDESCQRLVSSDADYLPGLIVELFEDVVRISLETAAVRAHGDFIAEFVREFVGASEVVVDKGAGPYTLSGQGLKGRWIEVDGLLYRIDLLNTEKPGFYLDQREQHPLFGSLCEGRAVLDLFPHSGAFALQAARAGAERATAVDFDDNYVKAIGANARRNDLQIATATADAFEFLHAADPGAFDAIVLDPPSAYFESPDRVRALHRLAFAGLPPGGLVATYCRNPASAGFETLVGRAAAETGREVRIFARTSQPFDFPILLNFPESQILQGVILQVE